MFTVDVTYFNLLLLVINNCLLTMITTKKKNKGRDHEKMGQEREVNNFASGTLQILNISF